VTKIKIKSYSWQFRAYEFLQVSPTLRIRRHFQELNIAIEVKKGKSWSYVAFCASPDDVPQSLRLHHLECPEIPVAEWKTFRRLIDDPLGRVYSVPPGALREWPTEPSQGTQE